jgi:hypothetical protein
MDYYTDARYNNWLIPGIDYFFIGIGFYTLFYLFFHNILQKNIKYTGLDGDRKLYVLKNLTKSCGLVVILYYAYILLYYKWINDKWINHLIYKIGFFYCSADVLGLLVVKNLPINSKIHHIATFIITLLVSQTDFENGATIVEAILIFTLLASKAFSVNLYLGWRHIYYKYTKKILTFAYYNYIITCGINVIYQYWMLYKFANFSILYFSYVSLCHFVIYDDIQLLKFLRYQRNKLLKSV